MMSVEMKYSNEFLWDTLKRILSLSCLGGSITSEDGHRWITWDVRDEYPLAKKLRQIVRCKVYGGVLEALDMIDEGLADLGEQSLSEQYSEDQMPLE